MDVAELADAKLTYRCQSSLKLSVLFTNVQTVPHTEALFPEPSIECLIDLANDVVVLCSQVSVRVFCSVVRFALEISFNRMNDRTESVSSFPSVLQKLNYCLFMSNIVACICKQALVIRLYEGVRHIYI